MKVRKISYTISNRYNVGEYESIGPVITLEATLEEGDTLSEAFAKLRAEAYKLHKETMRLELRKLRARRTNARDEVTQDIVDELVDYFDPKDAGKAAKKP